MNAPVFPPVNAPQPTPDERKALAQLIRDQLVTESSKKRRAMFEAMLRLVADDNTPSVLTPLHILKAMEKPVTPKAITNVRSTKNRLSGDFAKFFDYEEGRTQEWRMYFEEKDYRILFRPNDPPSTETDYLAEFWAPHPGKQIPNAHPVPGAMASSKMLAILILETPPLTVLTTASNSPI